MNVVPLNDEEVGAATVPRLLYIGEFPPSNHHGGAILLRRLLDKHPTDSLTIMASKLGMRATAAPDLLGCRHIAFPFLRNSPNFWVAKLKIVINCLILALVALRAVLVIKRQRVKTVISIIQGRYYLAAALAAWVTRTPHIVMVHDNFVSGNFAASTFTGGMGRRLTKRTLWNAAHIYAVSPEMQRLVLDECGMQSELQLPSTTIRPRQQDGHTLRDNGSGPVILFAGTVGYTVKDCLDLLVSTIMKGMLKKYGLPNARLHLCTPLTDAEILTFGWSSPGITNGGWVSQSELPTVLANADILFLPYSFSPGARKAVETAFPSKIADYLAAGKPILVLGPKYSSLVRYAREQGFAEIVEEFSSSTLARTIRKIAVSPVDRETLAAKGAEVLLANHDIGAQRRRFYRVLEQVISAGTPKTPRSKVAS